MRPLEIGICGSGPGGLAAALFLHRAGHKVRLIERFPEPKPVGSGLLLQPTGLAVLERLGLRQRIEERGQRIARLFGRSVPSDRVVLDVRYAALPGGESGLAVHRSALFGVLFEAVTREGIAIDTGRTVENVEPGSGGRTAVQCEGGHRIGPFDLVVDALGSRSPLVAALHGDGLHRPLAFGALWATLPWPGGDFLPDALEQRYRRSSVMVGVLPVGRPSPGDEPQTCFFWSLKAAGYDEWRRRGLPAWREEVAAVWPQARAFADQVADAGQLALARYGHHTLRQPHAGRTVAIGDAAHSTSPQLGQGANMALIDAASLSSAMEAGASIGEALALHARMRRLHVRIYQAMSLAFTPLYQSDSGLMPVLRDNLLALSRYVPGTPRLLASLVAGQWGAPLARLSRPDRQRQPRPVAPT